MDYLILDGEDMEYIWEIIENQQMIFHPQIAPDGKFDYKNFFERKRKKPFILFVDRNILSGLLKFCEQGALKDKGESQLIGIVMTWAKMNDIAISAGPAVQERTTQIKNQREGLIELNKFQKVFEIYPGQIWLKVARGEITEIPPIKIKDELAKEITVDYSEGCDHYYLALASMLRVVRLYRDNTMNSYEKMIRFIQWTYDYLLVGQYIWVYAILLFTNQEYVKIPKGANSNDILRIIKGCENQAWDLTYLSNWSTLYYSPENYNEEFLFATNDNLLKRIFINAHGNYGVNGLLHTVFSQKDYDGISDLIEHNQSNRIKPSFGNDSCKYFQQLIDEEIEGIKVLLK